MFTLILKPSNPSVYVCVCQGPLGAGTNDLSTLHVLFIRVESHENYTE